MREELTRDYRFSDAVLINLTNEKTSFAERDEQQFNQYGFTAIHRAALQNYSETFEAMPDDIELEADKMAATDNKQETRQKIEISTRQIMQRVKSAFGEKSPEYRRFGTKGLTQQRDPQLHITGNRVVRCANQYFSQLATYALTQAELDNYKNLVELFEEQMQLVKDKISDRDIGTENRIRTGNTLYRRLVAMCDTGKTIWEDVSEAHYNDYVIYNTPSGTDEGNDEGNEEENTPPNPPQ